MNELTDARILIVDDQAPNRLLVQRILEREGYAHIVSTASSDLVLSMFESSPPDLLVLDLQMPAPDGFAVMDLIAGWTMGDSYVPILVLTADVSLETRRRALQTGARDFLTKPLDAIEVSLRVRNLLTTRQLQQKLQAHNDALLAQVLHGNQDLDRARREAFHTLAVAAEYRDDDTRQHTQRVGRLAARLGSQLGLDRSMVSTLGQVAPLHDLGKIAISDAILLKPGRLTQQEFETIKKHSRLGAEILSGSNSPLFVTAASIALTHHERWDGTGYPDGLAGDAIPLAGRIVALADAFDAMSYTRPYKPAVPLSEVQLELNRCSGTHFDPAVTDAFNQLDPQALLEPIEDATGSPSGTATPVHRFVIPA
jgi:putative two-component system response regulator